MSHGASIETTVVIGAGLAGSAIACRLARVGLAPLILERDPQPRQRQLWRTPCPTFMTTCSTLRKGMSQHWRTETPKDTPGLRPNT
jgi:2-polyprenyl-6-methoxyphenol hydroxylase-like FAD-dependent oxidoreductase